METIFAFLLKASSGIVLFYLVYWFFLRKETFYSANRWFLLTALAAAVFLPLFPVQYSVLVVAENSKTVFKSISDTFKNIPVVAASELPAESFNWQQAVLLIYITGAVLFLFRLLTQTFILIHLMIKYRIKPMNGIRIVENEKYGLPFSFFNVVFINPKFHTQANLPEILAHEKVHIRERHWFDLLFIELLTVIFWFNPFIWFFERSIKQNHEYLADKGVLAQGHSAGRYQALLINQLMGMQIIGITNNLNFALNTNRLKMMTKKKTSRLLGAKFALALPALALLLFAFAEPNYKAKEVQLSGNEFSIENETSQKTVKMMGLVLDEGGNPLSGTSVVIKGSTIGTLSDIDGKFKLEVPEKSSIILSFVGKSTVVEHFSDISSGEKKDGTYYRNYHMKDDVILIDTELPPVPPQPKKNEEKLVSPPPPPLKTTGEQEVFFVVEDMPQYPGGYEGLVMDVQKQKKKLASKANLKGETKIGFTVNAKGKITDIKIVTSDNDLVGNAGAVIAEHLAEWSPGKQRGKAVPVKYLMHIEF